MNDIAKSIATSTIWISTSIILAFGLFEMSFNGGGWILFSLTVIFIAWASFSTMRIWKK